MARGPRPMPTNLRLLRGNVGHRRLESWREPQPVVPTEPPEPPEHLTGQYAREEWARVVVELYRMKLITSLDLQPLAAYCDAFERWCLAKATIAAMAERDPMTHGMIVKTQAGGAMPNPIVFMAQSAARDMVRYAAEFGLSPSARSRIKAVDALGKTGKFDGFLAG
jgi:P27 family predicted phage terminase small subunit